MPISVSSAALYRLTVDTTLTAQFAPQHGAPTRFLFDPRPLFHRRAVTDVAPVTTTQLSNPVPFFIAVKPHNRSLHGAPSPTEMNQGILSEAMRISGKKTA